MVVTLVGCSNINNKEQVATDKSFAEKIEVADLNGNKINLSDYNGKRIILNIWATWCKPCIQEMPSLEVMQQNLPVDKYVLLLASAEEVGKIKKLKDRNSYQLQFVQLQTSQESLGIYSLPTTFIIDENGELLVTENGMRDWGKPEVIQEIEQL